MSDVPELRALKRLRVAELRALLESRDVDSSGTKDALVNRLDACRAPVAPEDEDAPAPKKTKPAAPDAPSLASPSPPAPDARADPPTSKSPHAARLYVGFLGDNCDGDFVARLFAPHFTPASIHVPTSRRGDANVPRGFAFVDPPPDASPDAVASAVAALANPSVAPARPARSSSLPREPPSDGSHPTTVHLHPSTARSSPSVRVDSNLGRRLIVDGLPPDVTEETATRVFRAHGSVRSGANLRPERGENDVPRRATVEFETRDAAEAARARSRAPPRSSEVDPFASRGTASRARGIGIGIGIKVAVEATRTDVRAAVEDEDRDAIKDASEDEDAAKGCARRRRRRRRRRIRRGAPRGSAAVGERLFSARASVSALELVVVSPQRDVVFL